MSATAAVSVQERRRGMATETPSASPSGPAEALQTCLGGIASLCERIDLGVELLSIGVADTRHERSELGDVCLMLLYLSARTLDGFRVSSGGRRLLARRRNRREPSAARAVDGTQALGRWPGTRAIEACDRDARTDGRRGGSEAALLRGMGAWRRGGSRVHLCSHSGGGSGAESSGLRRALRGAVCRRLRSLRRALRCWRRPRW